MHGIKGLFRDTSFRVLIGVCAVFLLLPLFFTEPPKVGYGASYHEGQLMDSFTQDTTAGNIFTRGFSNYFKRLQKFYLGKDYTPVKKKGQESIALDGDIDLEGGPEIVLPEGNAEGGVRNAAGEVNIAGGAGGGPSAEDYGGGFSSGEASGVMYRTQKDKNGREYIEMDNGQKFQISTDKKGRRFVIIPGGAVPYKVFTDNFVSDKEFAKAKKAAPNLSKNELLLATKSDGGINGYLDDIKQFGRQGAFDKAQASLEAKFNRSAGGAASGAAGGGAGAAAKGGASGSFGTGGFDGSFDGSGNATAAGASAAAGLSGVSSKYQQKLSNVTSEATGRGSNQRMVDTTGLFANAGEPRIAGSREVGVEFGRSRGGDLYDVKINVLEKGSIIPKSDAYRAEIAKELDLDENFERTKVGDGKDLEKYPITIPVGQMDNPVQKFFDNNRDFLSKKGEDYSKAIRGYEDTRKVITDVQRDLKGKQYQVIAIDGNIDGKTIVQNEDSLAYQTVAGLFSGKVKSMAEGGVFQKDSQLDAPILSGAIAESKKKEILFVVKDAKQAEQMKEAGWNAVYFNLPTPKEFDSISEQTKALVEADLAKKKAIAADNEKIKKQLSKAMKGQKS